MRANFFRGVITDGKDEIELRSTGQFKFIPTLAAQSRGRKMRGLQLPQRPRMHSASRMTARTVSREPRQPSMVQDSFRYDRPRRVAGTQEQYVEMRPHHLWDLSSTLDNNKVEQWLRN